MLRRLEQMLCRVVQRLEEAGWHLYNGARDDVLLFLLEHFHLFVRLHLGLFEIGLARHLPLHTLVFAARLLYVLAVCGIVQRHWCYGKLAVSTLLKFELFQFVERNHVVEIGRQVRLHLFEEARYVVLVLEGQLLQILSDRMRVELKCEAHVSDVVLCGRRRVSSSFATACILRYLVVLGYLTLHVGTRADSVPSDPVFNLCEALSGPHLADKLIGYLQKDGD